MASQGSPSSTSPIILGITGHRHIPKDVSTIKDQLKIVFDAFSEQSSAKGKSVYQLREDLGFMPEHAKDGIPKSTPIWLLCPMAHGADIFAAIEADNFYRKHQHDFRIIAPLPTPWDYRKLPGDSNPPDNPYDHEFKEFQSLRKKIEEFVLPLGGRGPLRKSVTFEQAGHSPHNALTWQENVSNLATRKDYSQAFDDLLNKKDSSDDEKSWEDRQFEIVAHYVALYSHVLIGLWDGNIDSDDIGADAGIRLKLQGPSPKHLSHPPIFNWADAGPVIQIYTPNENPQKDPNDAATSFPGALTAPGSSVPCVLHPDDCKGDTQIQDGGKRVFQKSLNATIAFNEDITSRKELDKNYQAPFEGSDITSLKEEDITALSEDPNRAFDQKLAEIHRKASRVSARANELKRSKDRHYAGLFLTIVVAAISMHFYAHYYAGFEQEVGPSHHVWLLAVFVLLVLGAIIHFSRKLHHPRLESKLLEYRAIAEAVRIQLMWMTAGLPQSVALHYLQRHRGSFDWVRNTVSAWCFPYEDAERRYQTLNLTAKANRLSTILTSWVKDQRDFFENNHALESHLHHALHRMGIATAGIGFAAALFLLALQPSWGLPVTFARCIGFAVFLLGFLLLGIALLLSHPHGNTDPGYQSASVKARSPKTIKYLSYTALTCPPLAALFCPPLAYDASHPQEHWPSVVVLGVGLTFLTAAALFVFLRFFYQKDKTRLPKFVQSWIGKPEKRVLPYLPLFLCLVGFGLLGGATLLATPLKDAHVEHTSPPTESIAAPQDEGAEENDGHESHGRQFPYILAIGIPLLLGALLVAWGEKQLHSENANRYLAARELFRLSQKRLETLFTEFGHSSDEKRKTRILQEMQEIYFELGKEALSENAEWLLLHRARPLEFPMAA